jgi:hypothetical protein
MTDLRKLATQIVLETGLDRSVPTFSHIVSAVERILREAMPGDYWQHKANAALYYNECINAHKVIRRLQRKIARLEGGDDD